MVVPNTDKMKGIETACIAGFVAGHPERRLQVLAYINAAEKALIKKYVEADIIKINVASEPDIFYIRVEAERKGHTASVTIRRDHTNITSITKNSKIILAGKRTHTMMMRNPYGK